MDSVDLAIRLTADADDATRALEGVGDAAGRMASDVDAATAKADDASSRIDSMAESSDNMASRSAQAAGGIGDLAGALEQTGFISEGTAMAMEGASAAIMGVTGASDLLNLVTTSSIVVKAKDRAATIAHAVSSRAAAVATRAQAVAQRVLNVAMRANPIGIILTLLAGLVALVVLAYKRSETFRRIIDKAWDVAKAGAMAVVKALGVVVSWIAGKVVGAWRAMQAAAAKVWTAVRSAVQGAISRVVGFVTNARDRIGAAWQGIRDSAGRAWDWVRDKVSAVVTKIRDLVTGIGDKVRAAGDAVRTALGGAFDWVMDKVQPLIDKVQWLIDKIQSIDLPNIPGLGRVVSAVTPSGRAMTTAPEAAGGGNTYVTINVDATASDPHAVGRKIDQVMSTYVTGTGRRLRWV